MMKIFIQLFFIFLIPSLGICETLEMRVLDQSGLTRAVRRVEGSTATVAITLNVKDLKTDRDVIVKDINGIQGDVINKIDNRGNVVFHNLPVGAWQIIQVPSSAIVKSVRISQK